MEKIIILEYIDLTKKQKCRYNRRITRLNRRTRWHHIKRWVLDLFTR